MKNAMRFFSLGLLVSALLVYGFQFFSGNSSDASSIDLEDMISEVEKQGYHVVDQEEYISFSLSKEEAQDNDNSAEPKKDAENKTAKADKTKEEKSKEDKQDKSNENENEEPVKEEASKATFKVGQGVYTPQIADILVEKKIIDDKQKFIKYMDENGYSDYIQLGTFKVTSDMSLKELAETLTTYPGN